MQWPVARVRCVASIRSSQRILKESSTPKTNPKLTMGRPVTAVRSPRVRVLKSVTAFRRSSSVSRTGPQLQDLGRDGPSIVRGSPALMGHIQSGKLRAIASARRSDLFYPDVPTWPRGISGVETSRGWGDGTRRKAEVDHRQDGRQKLGRH